MLFSEEACETINTLIPLSASAEKIRLFTPITPTIPSPVIVIRAVSLIEDIPFIILPSLVGLISLMSVPLDSGLNVFLI